MWREMVLQLKGILGPVVTTTPLNERCLSAERLAEEFEGAGTEALWRDDIGEALDLGRGLADDLLVVTGSFFIVGEAMNLAWMNGWIRLPEKGSEQEQVIGTFGSC